MKYLLPLVFIIFSLKSYSQLDTIQNIQSVIKFHVNIRNAKFDTISFDYYFSISSKTTIKEFLTFELTASYERDNGNNYLSHNEKVSCDYGQIGNIYNEDRDMKMFYMTIHYPIKKMFKIGYDISYNYSQEINHSIYLSAKWKYIESEIAFLDKIHRIKYKIEPIIKLKKKLKLGLEINGLYINQRFKWQNGFVLNYTIK